MPRPDSRDSNAIRTLGVSMGTLIRSDGSAKYQVGTTSVLCAVLGPIAAKPREELMDKTYIRVVVTPLVGQGGRSDVTIDTQERMYERILSRTASALVLDSLYPRTLIKITCQVLSDDGSVLSAAINAMTLALMDAGVSLRSTCSAISVMIDNDGVCILDPTTIELEVGSNLIQECAIVTYVRVRLYRWEMYRGTVDWSVYA